MITNEQIRQTINDCTKAGHAVGMRDISYVLLCKHYEDKATAYRILFGLDADFNADYAATYDQTASMNYLRDYIEFNLNDGEQKKKKKKRISDDDDISFEENKAEIIRLIKQTQELLAKGDIEAKDAVKIEADLRVKLNDKFGASEQIQDQVVHVFTKYNSICSSCGREIYIPTKEDLMKKYGLTEE